MLSGLKNELVEYVMNEGEKCPKCGGRLKVMGKDIVCTEVEFIQAKLIVKQIVRQVAKCENCGKHTPDLKRLEIIKDACAGPTVADIL
ncbi:IS66 family transposase zinc-finger binding domain-containing protein [Clostridium sp. E02]|uniref:IS66 family transposase zinc-finger binding domain-containing protein n=1 Tax=Clostridium sp. E02 TaxID=2487134 RepID=UPI000F52A7CE|nr:IS66 family transposase zinc-finger binding domain-containing protein [Clostridium sp. E02]